MSYFRLTRKLRQWFADCLEFFRKANFLDILQDPRQIRLNSLPLQGWMMFTLRFQATKKSVTVLTTYTAAGTALPPFIVYPYERKSEIAKKSLPKFTFLILNYAGWGYNHSKIGWMNQAIFLDYLSNHFLPSMKACSSVTFPIFSLLMELQATFQLTWLVNFLNSFYLKCSLLIF